ncbi:MAG: flagellar hook-length control protein FliK [Planctomycetes bacterium]|nr:flagellar hook-length control protein FliK [Planctomycetota bacterium]
MDVFIDTLLPAPPADRPSASATAPPQEGEPAESFEKHLKSARPDDEDSVTEEDAVRSSTDSLESPQAAESVGGQANRSDEGESSDEEAASPPGEETTPLVVDLSQATKSESSEADDAELQLVGPLSLGNNDADDTPIQSNADESSNAQSAVQEIAGDETDAQDQESVEKIVLVKTTKSRKDETENSAVNEPDSTEVSKPQVANSETTAIQTSSQTQEDDPTPAPKRRQRSVNSKNSDVVATADTASERTRQAAEAALLAHAEGNRDDSSGKKEAATNEPASAKTAQIANSPDSGLGRLPRNLIPRSQRTDSDQPQPQIDHVRFVRRVAKAFEVAQQRDGQVRLRLHPPELGAIRLELRVRGNVLSAHVEAETATARGLLIDNLPALRERLAEQGIQIEQFEVDLRQRQAADQRNATGEQDQSQSGTSQHANETPHDESQTEDRDTHSILRQIDGELNVVV